MFNIAEFEEVALKIDTFCKVEFAFKKKNTTFAP